MQEPAACGALPAQHARLHIEPLAIAAEGMFAQRIDKSSAEPRSTLVARKTVEPQACLFNLSTIHI